MLLSQFSTQTAPGAKARRKCILYNCTLNTVFTGGQKNPPTLTNENENSTYWSMKTCWHNLTYRQKVTKSFNTFLLLKHQIWHDSPALSSRKEIKFVREQVRSHLNKLVSLFQSNAFPMYKPIVQDLVIKLYGVNTNSSVHSCRLLFCLSSTFPEYDFYKLAYFCKLVKPRVSLIRMPFPAFPSVPWAKD